MAIKSILGSRSNPNHTLGERRKVIAHASDATLTVGESGSMITTEGANANVNLTLPAVAVSTGVHYWFVNAENYNFTITGPTDTLVTFNDDAADTVAFSTTNEKVGGGAFVYCDGSKWMVQLMTYDGADQEVSITT